MILSFLSLKDQVLMIFRHFIYGRRDSGSRILFVRRIRIITFFCTKGINPRSVGAEKMISKP